MPVIVSFGMSSARFRSVEFSEPLTHGARRCPFAGDTVSCGDFVADATDRTGLLEGGYAGRPAPGEPEIAGKAAFEIPPLLGVMLCLDHMAALRCSEDLRTYVGEPPIGLKRETGFDFDVDDCTVSGVIARTARGDRLLIPARTQ